jgi:hypothetical protein
MKLIDRRRMREIAGQGAGRWCAGFECRGVFLAIYPSCHIPIPRYACFVCCGCPQLVYF